MKKTIIAVSIVALLTGCATQPDKIAPTSVSTIQYEDFSCKQVGAELNRIQRRSGELYRSLKGTADGDAAQMAVGMVLFWPALFFIDGKNSPEATEYARLKGEMEALEAVSVRKQCGIDFPKAPKVEKKVINKEVNK